MGKSFIIYLYFWAALRAPHVLKHIPWDIRKAVVMGYYCASIPCSCLKINMVSTIVLRLQQSLRARSRSLSLPASLSLCLCQGLSKGAEGYSLCLLSKWIALGSGCLIEECILQGGMGAGVDFTKIPHGVDLWKLLNMEVALLSYCTAV